jgi:hypothetical protein
VACVAVTNDYTRDEDMTGADLVLAGFGPPGPEAVVVHDPHAVGPSGRLDLGALRRLHQRRNGAAAGRR